MSIKIKIVLCFLVFFTGLLFVGCATNLRSISEGNYFSAHFDHYDSSMPVEEQCAFLVLDSSRQFSITEINGKKSYRYGQLVHRSLTVLPPGQYIFTINELIQTPAEPMFSGIDNQGHFNNNLYSDSFPTTEYNIYTILVSFQSGHYYFFTSDSEYGMIIDDVKNYSEIAVGNTLVPVEIIIEGIDASIARGIKK